MTWGGGGGFVRGLIHLNPRGEQVLDADERWVEEEGAITRKKENPFRKAALGVQMGSPPIKKIHIPQIWDRDDNGGISGFQARKPSSRRWVKRAERFKEHKSRESAGREIVGITKFTSASSKRVEKKMERRREG